MTVPNKKFSKDVATCANANADVNRAMAAVD